MLINQLIDIELILATFLFIVVLGPFLRYRINYFLFMTTVTGARKEKKTSCLVDKSLSYPMPIHTDRTVCKSV